MSKVRFLLMSMVMAVLASCGTVQETPKEPTTTNEPNVPKKPEPAVVEPTIEEGVVAIEEALPKEMSLSLQNLNLSNDYRMVYVQGGIYTMGNGEVGKKRVSVKGFYMGETEVTQALWKEVMGNNPSHF